MNTSQKLVQFLILIPTILFWITTNLHYFWIKIGGSIFIFTTIFQLLCLIIILISIILIFIKIIKYRSFRNPKNILTLIFSIFIILTLFYKDLRFNQNSFQSKVVVTACANGTQNGSKFLLRKNFTFEYYNISFFAYVKYSKGTWKNNGDTIVLNFTTKNTNILSNKILIKNNMIYNVRNNVLNETNFYIDDYKKLD